MPQHDFMCITKALDRAYTNEHEKYGQGLGDVGASEPFLENKQGDKFWLNAEAWKLLLPQSEVIPDLYGIELDWVRPF